MATKMLCMVISYKIYFMVLLFLQVAIKIIDKSQLDPSNLAKVISTFSIHLFNLQSGLSGSGCHEID